MTEERTAIVTGGATGIGAACCRALAAEGLRVGIHYRSSEGKAQALAGALPGSFLLKADLSDAEQVDAMLERIKENTSRVDVLVNNAGSSINADINAMRLEQFDSQRSIVRGTWLLTKRILRRFMLRQAAGRIINISSVVGHTGNPGQIPYTMEKAALDAFSKSLSLELAGRNILVNSVAPGFVDTEMTGALPDEVRERIMRQIPLARIGKPEEIADVVAFLATRGSYINGTVIHVNGGLYGG